MPAAMHVRPDAPAVAAGDLIHPASPSRPVRVPILMYHSIADHASEAFRPWAVPPSLFAAHLATLRAGGCTPITVARLAAILAGADDDLPAHPVVLTFDDGFADFYELALPMLAEHQFASTLYITTGYVGGSSRWLRWEGEGDRPMLTWAQVREVAGAGVEIGAHSHRHPQLDTLARRAAWDEIVGPKLILEDRIGQAVETFAYPHGYHDRTVKQLVMQAGYRAACGVKHALSTLADDRFALARIIVTPDVDATGLGTLLQGAGLETAPFPERLRTRGWRLARRTAAWLQVPALGVRPLGAGGEAGDGRFVAVRRHRADGRTTATLLAQAVYESTASPRLRREVNALRHTVAGRADVARARQLLPAILARLASALDDASIRAWTAQRLTYTESDVVVALLGPRDRPPALVAKLAVRPAARTILGRQVQALRRLAGAALGEEWQRLVPRVVLDEAIEDHVVCVESALPGRPRLAELADPGHGTRMQLEALRALDALHRHGARSTTVDASLLERWVDGPVELIQRAIGPATRLVGLRDELRQSLLGRPVVVTCIHGDFWPGNLLFARAGGALTGVVDWDLAADDELPIHDVLNLLLSAQALVRGQDLGSLIGARIDGNGWSAFERYVLDRHAASPVASAIPERSLVLLYWLRYVATYLEKSPTIVGNAWWVSRNLDGVPWHGAEAAGGAAGV